LGGLRRDLELEASQKAAALKDEALATQAEEKAALEAVAAQRESQLEASRAEGEAKAAELEKMGEETKAKEAELSAMADEKAALEKAAEERESQLEASRAEGEAKAAELEKAAEERAALEKAAEEAAKLKEAELGLMAEEKATLEKADAERSSHITSLIEMFSETLPIVNFSAGLGEDGDEQAFTREWVERCEGGGGSWGEKHGFKAIVVDDEPAWECTACNGGYYAYHLDPAKEEFWMSFECCEEDCTLAKSMQTTGGGAPLQASRSSTPVRGRGPSESPKGSTTPKGEKGSGKKKKK